MHLSYNELLLTSQKVFEGLGHSIGTYEDAAEAIAWLELHGIPTLASVYAERRSLVGPLKVPLVHTHDEGSEGNQTIRISLNQNHLIVCGSFVVDYLRGLAIAQGNASAIITNSSKGLLLLPHLAKCSQSGLEVDIYWIEPWGESVFQWTHARFGLGSAVPQLTMMQITDEKTLEQQSDKIFISLRTADEERRPDNRWAGAASTLVYRKFPRWFVNNKRANLSKGIKVKKQLWQAWTLLAKAVLVEATEESRLKGAGEQSVKVNRAIATMPSTG